MDGKKIVMQPGSIVVYKGIELEHSRDEFTPPNFENDWHVQAFLHYVNANGENSDWKFDKRESIGSLKNEKRKGYITYV